MEYRSLGQSDIQVSLICLGTMTWGEQNTQDEAFAQLDYAVGKGVNFVDAAELYPVPPKAATHGATETIIGNWLTARKNRDKVVLATKVMGIYPGCDWVRGGQARLDRKNIEQALHDSLKRLKTDYIDLYQVHWPDRNTNYFGELGYVHDPDDRFIPIEETLSVLNDCVHAGKVRTIGISNETPWGMLQYLEQAERKQLARIVSIQNPYSLLNRTFEVGLAEMAIRERCGLLAYSPLAFGRLSGKYLKPNPPPLSRLVLFGNHFTRYSNELALAATERYVALAEDNGLSPAQMALAFVNTRPFVTSNIIGATTLDQLEENIASHQLRLSEDIVSEIDQIHLTIPNPSP